MRQHFDLMPKASEHQHQQALFSWAERSLGKYPELALMFAIPNGGKRDKATAGKLKGEGVKAGVPDICLPVARHGFNGLFIELKTESGRATREQIEWLNKLAEQGYMTAIIHGWESARDTLKAYLDVRGVCDNVRISCEQSHIKGE